MNERFKYRIAAARRRMAGRAFNYSILVFLLALILISGLVMFLVEKNSNPDLNTYGDAIWLLFVTLSTVGYGDISPVTTAGRITDVVTMILGVSAVMVYLSVRAVLKVEQAKRAGIKLKRSSKSPGNIVICGWNSRGEYLVSGLRAGVEKQHIPVILMCDVETNPIDDGYVLFLTGNQVRKEDLQRANVQRARVVVLLADEASGGEKGDVDARTVLAAMAVRSINEEVPVIAEVLEAENVEHLRMVGVSEILDSSRMMGGLMARSALRPGVIEVVTQLATQELGRHIFRVAADEDMEGRDYRRLRQDLRKERGYTLLAVESEGDVMAIDEDARVSPGDVLIVMADEQPTEAL